MSTQTRIAAARQEFTTNGFATFVVVQEGETFTCFVLPQKLCTELPDFAYQQVSDDRTGITCPDDASVFGVCESVPEKFRQFVVLHEILEYWIGGTCGDVAAREMEAVRASRLSDAEQREYVQMRKAFFERLVPYTVAKQYPAHKIQEFRASLAFFTKLVS